MAELVLDHLTKRFADGTEAVHEADFTIGDGEFFILVGPSGCGKSTLLNMIVGLEDISEGELRVDGDVINEIDPKDRNMAMVFQSYAIYPHMTVRQNMEFPLKLAKVPKDEMDRRVDEAAKILELTELLAAQARQPVGRPAPAGGHGPSHRPGAVVLPDGRAAVEPRRQAAGADAHGHLPAAAAAGDHHRLRDPRPDRGHDPGRPRGGAAQGPGAAGGLPAGALQQAGQRVRGRVHRVTRDEPAVRHPRRRPPHPSDGGLDLPDVVRQRLGDRRPEQVIAGIRPEHFEDAALVERCRQRASPSPRPST